MTCDELEAKTGGLSTPEQFAFIESIYMVAPNEFSKTHAANLWDAIYGDKMRRTVVKKTLPAMREYAKKLSKAEADRIIAIGLKKESDMFYDPVTRLNFMLVKDGTTSDEGGFMHYVTFSRLVIDVELNVGSGRFDIIQTAHTLDNPSPVYPMNTLKDNSIFRDVTEKKEK